MASRPNPWDPAFRLNNNRSITENQTQPFGDGLSTTAGTQGPPPVPSRALAAPGTSYGINNFPLSSGGFGNMLGMGGLGGYGGYGGYSGYGGLPSYSRSLPGYGGDAGPNITQLVESQLRPGFDSIYSVVQAFSSVSMMLESTYFALQNTVRAAVGMADHFQRIGSSLRQLLLAAPLVSWLLRAVRRLLAWLGVIRADPQRVWAAMERRRQEAAEKPGGPTWPMLMFLSIAVGGPFLIWQLLRSLLRVQSETTSQWTSGQAEHYVAKALFDFTASREDELPFKSGDSLRIAPKNLQPNINGWLLAAQGGRMGLIPANHVNVLGRMLPSGQLQSEKDSQNDSQKETSSPTKVTDSDVKLSLDT